MVANWRSVLDLMGAAATKPMAVGTMWECRPSTAKTFDFQGKTESTKFKRYLLIFKYCQSNLKN